MLIVFLKIDEIWSFRDRFCQKKPMPFLFPRPKIRCEIGTLCNTNVFARNIMFWCSKVLYLYSLTVKWCSVADKYWWYNTMQESAQFNFRDRPMLYTFQSTKINRHTASTETFCLWLTLNHAMSTRYKATFLLFGLATFIFYIPFSRVHVSHTMSLWLTKASVTFILNDAEQQFVWQIIYG